MAKDCAYFQIEVTAAGQRNWKRKVGPFRDTNEGALRRFNAYCKVAPPNVSARLAYARVLEQKNGVLIKDH